jgi:hypothetical protein
LLFSLAITLIIIGNAILDLGIMGVFMNSQLIKKSSLQQTEEEPFINNNLSITMTKISNDFLNTATIVLIGGYLFFWSISAFLLYKYFHRLRKTKQYWIIIFLPPILVLMGTIPLLQGIPNSDFTYFNEDSLFFRIITTMAAIIGGIIFGVSFFILARGFRKIGQDIIANYLDITGYGIALLVIQIMASIIFIPYPPFGSATCSILGIASYAFFVGIYSSVISVSNDARLRKSIRKAVEEELKLLDKMGTLEMRDQMENNIENIVREYSNKMDNEVGVKPYFSEDSIRDHLDEVLRELKRNDKYDKI